MGIWNKIKKGLDFVFYIRPKKWIGWDSLKKSTLDTVDLVKATYTLKKDRRVETFNQAISRHQLEEADIQQIKKRFYIFSIFFLVMALALVIYAIDSFVKGGFTTGIVTLCLSTFVTAQSFRYHFWYFQICKRKLGCTFRDWLVFINS